MSPPVGSGGKHSESAQARLLGSGTSGVAELLVFHPVDTVAKRLMSNKVKSAKVSMDVGVRLKRQGCSKDQSLWHIADDGGGLQGQGQCTGRRQVCLTVSGAWVCCW